MSTSNLEKPRSLKKTNTSFEPVKGSDNQTYGNPFDLAHKLYCDQGSADEGYQGTCGLCSVANILRLADVSEADEKMILGYYKKTFGLPTWLSCLAPIFRLPETIKWKKEKRKEQKTQKKSKYQRGGTKVWQLKSILRHYGIACFLLSTTPYNDYTLSNDELTKCIEEKMDEIARLVEEGHGVLISLDANIYKSYIRKDKQTPLTLVKTKGIPAHAVVITSVERDNTGAVLGFFLHDSNKQPLAKGNIEHQHEFNPVYLKSRQLDNCLITNYKIIVSKTIVR